MRAKPRESDCRKIAVEIGQPFWPRLLGRRCPNCRAVPGVTRLRAHGALLQKRRPEETPRRLMPHHPTEAEPRRGREAFARK